MLLRFLVEINWINKETNASKNNLFQKCVSLVFIKRTLQSQTILNTKEGASIKSVTIMIFCTAAVAVAEWFVHEYEYCLQWMGTHNRKSRKRMFLVPWLKCLSLRWCTPCGMVVQEFAQLLYKESLKFSLVLFLLW